MRLTLFSSTCSSISWVQTFPLASSRRRRLIPSSTVIIPSLRSNTNVVRCWSQHNSSRQMKTRNPTEKITDSASKEILHKSDLNDSLLYEVLFTNFSTSKLKIKNQDFTITTQKAGLALHSAQLWKCFSSFSRIFFPLYSIYDRIFMSRAYTY